MMRSLFSGVAGLRTHQTRMDVIGNNIANVNTTSYKSQSMVFSDLLYQTTQAASGANANTGRGGVNARQIGLGAKTAAISTAITAQGSAQSTNNPFDIMITGESFFVVNNGSENFFTRDGSFTIDGAGNLVMSSTGYKVMGWQTDPETGDILPDTVSALQVMNADNLTYPPEATTRAYVSGIVDMYDSALKSTSGKIMTLGFFDNRGYKYTGKFSIHSLDEDGQYYVQLDDILDEDGVSVVTKYGLSDIGQVASFGTAHTVSKTTAYDLLDSASYDAATKTYSLKYQIEDALQGYSDNVIILNTKNPTITADKNDNPTKATITGKVELDKDLLEDELGLLFDAHDDPDPADATKTVKVNHYYYKNEVLPNTTFGADGTATDATALGKWQTALQSIIQAGSESAKITVKSVVVDASSGELTIDYSAELTVDPDLKVTSYDPDAKIFKGDKIDDPLKAYGLADTNNIKYQIVNTSDGGRAQITKSINYTGFPLEYDIETGEFSYIGTQGNDAVLLDFNPNATSLTGGVVDLSFFYDTTIDFSMTSNVANGGTCTAGMTSGDGSENNLGAGRKNGELIGIEVGQDGRLTATYDNGQSKLLGQIAVANFANAAGLSKEGENLYSATMNSGEFDGVGDDITATGGKMNSGVLEMSNVDLSAEFTEMITTQRGFQANSRIITTSDTLLEELVNLKR